MNLPESCIIGTGSYLPKQRLNNHDLEKFLDTDDEWIRRRTGITHRHLVAEDEDTCSIAVEASRAAIHQAKIKPTDINLVILATTTPDNIFPATAAKIQHSLGIPPCAFFDLQAVCSGFIHALAMADNMLKLGQAKTALVVGAEIYSKILDWQDRATSVLFGDGAGAVILQAKPPTKDKRGILSTHLFGDGQYYNALYVDGGVTQKNTNGYVRMQGREVYRLAIVKMAEAVEVALKHNGYKSSDLQWLVPHQANLRIITAVADSLKLNPEKVIVTVQEHANISAATIPVALNHGVQSGLFKNGDLVALSALGGGFSWGSVLLKWV